MKKHVPHRAAGKNRSTSTPTTPEKSSTGKQGRGVPTPKAVELIIGGHRAASDALIAHARKSVRVEPLIAFEGMIFGDPWCTEVCIGDHLHIDKRKPLPGELIIIEDHFAIRVHRFVSFDGRTWTLRSRRGQLVTLPDSDAAYWGVVIAITQIRTIEVNRKTIDPWDALQGRCVGFAGPHPATCSKTRAHN